MQAVILAGGLGTRLRPVTDTMPKGLVPVLGRPFVEYQLDLLRTAGLTRVLLSVGYLGSMFSHRLGDGSRVGVRLEYVSEPFPMGTGGALRNAMARLAPEFLVLYGDTYLPIDYADLVHDFGVQRSLGLIVAYEGDPRTCRRNLTVTRTGQVSAYDKRDDKGKSHTDAGAVVLKKAALDLVPPRMTFSLEENLYPKLIAKGELRAYVTRLRFYDMGTFEGLRLLEGELR
jgi:NDP-sugar pyrophosphorylase family protein